MSFIEQKIATNDKEILAKRLVVETLEKTAELSGCMTDDVLLEFGFEKAAEYLKEAAYSQGGSVDNTQAMKDSQERMKTDSNGKTKSDSGSSWKDKLTKKNVGLGLAGAATITGAGLGVRELLKRRKAKQAKNK